MSLPKTIESFLLNLYNYSYTRDLDSVRKLYEVDYYALSETYYGDCPWPSLDQVTAFYTQHDKQHQLILILYQELWHRHIFSRCPDRVSWQSRGTSYHNYTLLFEFLLGTQCNPRSPDLSLCLPGQWLWDMFEAYCYQFEEAQRKKWDLLDHMQDVSSRPEQELMSLSALWSVTSTLRILYSFVQTSEINSSLEMTQKCCFAYQNPPAMHLQIGYMALIALIQLNTSMSDYAHALDIAKPILKHMSNCPAGCHSRSFLHNAAAWLPGSARASFIYNTSFSAFMASEHDTLYRCAFPALNECSRSKAVFYGRQGSPQAKKTIDRNLDSLAILVLLANELKPASASPHFNEGLLAKLKEQHKSIFQRIHQSMHPPVVTPHANRESEETLREIVKSTFPARVVAPAFWTGNIQPALVAMQREDCIINRNLGILDKRFSRQKRINHLLSLANLYNNISLEKLAILAGCINDTTSKSFRAEIIENIRADLIAASSSEMDFIIDDNSVHVFPRKESESYTEIFRSQTKRLQDLLNRVKAIDVTKIAVA